MQAQRSGGRFNCVGAIGEVGMAKSYYKFQFQMKSRLSIEIKGLLEPKKLGGSRCNPESASNITTSSTTVKPLKRSESSSTLRRTDTDISIIEDRYRVLERNYRDLLDETRTKGDLFRKQRQQLDRLRQAHDRDQKEIAQLRTLLEIARRNPPRPQPTLQQSQAFSAKPERHGSSVPRERRSPLGKHPAVASGRGSELTEGCLLRKGSRVRVQQGFSKYKFVPSLPLC